MKNTAQHPKIRNGPVQMITVGNSIRLKWINKYISSLCELFNGSCLFNRIWHKLTVPFQNYTVYTKYKWATTGDFQQCDIV